MPKMQFQCVRCDKEFFKYPCQVRDPHNVFCSRECHNVRTGEQRVCPTCGGSFYAHKSAIALGYSTYCSRVCSNPARGRALDANPNWKGGRFLRSDGYVAVRVSNVGYRLEHDLLVESSIGRSLRSNENVHHLNGDRSDNRVGNLELTTRSRHIKEHHCPHRDPGSWSSVACLHCGKVFDKRSCEIRKTNHHFCGWGCWVAHLNMPLNVGDRGPSQLHLDVKQALSDAGIDTTTHVPIGPWLVDEAYMGGKMVVEIKGCYWHSCPVCDLKGPGSNPSRDLRKTADLVDRGWTVLDVWEHEWRTDPVACIARIKTAWEPFVVGRKPNV